MVPTFALTASLKPATASTAISETRQATCWLQNGIMFMCTVRGCLLQGLRQWLAFRLARDTGKWSPKTTYIEVICRRTHHSGRVQPPGGSAVDQSIISVAMVVVTQELFLLWYALQLMPFPLYACVC